MKKETFNLEAETFRVEASHGVPFEIRVLADDDRYGAYRDGQWALRVERGSEPLVEFYDARHRHTPFGQFVSRYQLSSLVDHRAGLNLAGGISDWKIDAQSLRTAMSWAQQRLKFKQEQNLAVLALEKVTGLLEEIGQEKFSKHLTGKS